MVTLTPTAKSFNQIRTSTHFEALGEKLKRPMPNGIHHRVPVLVEMAVVHILKPIESNTRNIQ